MSKFRTHPSSCVHVCLLYLKALSMKKIRISHSHPSYYTTGLKCKNQLYLRMQADLFKKSKLSVPGERIVLKLVNSFQEGVPGTSVAKLLSHCRVEVYSEEKV